MLFILRYIGSVKAPLLFLLTFFIFHILSSTGVLPSLDHLVALIQGFFGTYGLLAVAICSFIENLFGINMYFPGSVVILTAMAMTAGNPLLGLMTYGTIFGFALMAYHVNYFMGRVLYTGKYAENNVSKKTDYELWAWYLGSFWHPHFTAVTCVITGSEGFSYKWFLARTLVVGFVWNSFWALTMYNFGSLAKEDYDLMPVMYLYLAGWLLIDSYKYIKKNI